MTVVISLSEENTLHRLAHLTLNHTSADKPGDNEEIRRTYNAYVPRAKGGRTPTGRPLLRF